VGHQQLQVALVHQPTQAKTSMEEEILSNGGRLLNGKKVEIIELFQYVIVCSNALSESVGALVTVRDSRFFV